MKGLALLGVKYSCAKIVKSGPGGEIFCRQASKGGICFHFEQTVADSCSTPYLHSSRQKCNQSLHFGCLMCFLLKQKEHIFGFHESSQGFALICREQQLH